MGKVRYLHAVLACSGEDFATIELQRGDGVVELDRLRHAGPDVPYLSWDGEAEERKSGKMEEGKEGVSKLDLDRV